MQKKSRLTSEESKRLYDARGSQIDQQRQAVWQEWNKQFSGRQSYSSTNIYASVPDTPETTLGRQFGFISDMPQEFKEEVEDKVPETACKKAQNLLIDILSLYYNVSTDAKTVYLKVRDESLETNTPKARVIRCIVWNYYGHDAPPENKWFKAKREKKETNEKIKSERTELEGKCGIERFYTPDLNNKIDNEITGRIRGSNENNSSPNIEERVCRRILLKRLGCGCRVNSSDKEKADAEIMVSIERRCKKHKKEWNEIVRELFCIEFNIKT